MHLRLLCALCHPPNVSSTMLLVVAGQCHFHHRSVDVPSVTVFLLTVHMVTLGIILLLYFYFPSYYTFLLRNSMHLQCLYTLIILFSSLLGNSIDKQYALTMSTCFSYHVFRDSYLNCSTKDN